MAGFHVYVEGATDGSPTGIDKLADAIANHYGMPSAELLARLRRGRVRVKANTDRATAEQYKRDLDRLGARCTIEEATPENSQRITPTPFPATKPPQVQSGPTPKPATKPPQFQSGLSAAFTNDSQSAGLGALERDDIALSLADVDGGEQAALTGASEHLFGPPGGEATTAAEKPPPKAAPRTPPKKSERPKDVPLDLFTPPEAQGEELRVDIATDDLDVVRKRTASTPIPPAEPSGPVVRIRKSGPVATQQPSQPIARQGSGPIARPTSGRATSQPIATSTTAASKSRFGPLGDPRIRFVAGVLLAIVLGFVPAHFVAAMREHSAYTEIDSKVRAVQQLADTPETYATLDRMRAAQLAHKKSERRTAALIAFAIWTLVGGGIAFVWFRKIPWES